MPLYNVEIKVTRFYQVDGIRAKDEDKAIEKAMKKFYKDSKVYFDDEEVKTDAVEIN